MNSSNAIVVSQNPFGEADRYVQFITKKWGMITVLAKAARKSRRRYVGGLDLFCHDEIFIRGLPKQSPYLVELTVLNPFLGLRDSLERLLTAGRMAQWVKKLANTNNPMPEVFSLFGQTLSITEKESNPRRLELLTLVFKAKLLAMLGFRPNLETCVECKNPEEERFHFDIENGALLCAPCSLKKQIPREKLDLLPHELLLMRNLEFFRLPNWANTVLSMDSVSRLSKILTDFALFHTHTKLPV